METLTALKGRYTPGRIDGGRAFVEWELTAAGRFSMSGEIWDRQGSDCVTVGQCVDEIADAFPNDQKLQRMREIWKRWHLNDMKAGSPAQEQWLQVHAADWEAYKAQPTAPGKYADHYTWAKDQLAAAGLNPDKSYRYSGPGAANIRDEGAGYPYGAAWIREELPPEVVLEIAAWSEAPGAAPEPVEPFADFIKSRGITVDLEVAEARPGWEGDPGATHWKVTLKKGGRRMSCHYSQGSAWTSEPLAGDILRSLVSDAQLVDERDFAEFCRNLGENEDSRWTERTYKACVKEAQALRRFLGDADYKFCLYGE